MNRKRLQNRVAESRMALPLTAVYATAVCLTAGACCGFHHVAFALVVVSAFLMMELNNLNALIRIYSRMVSCAYLVLTVMSVSLVRDLHSGVIAIAFVLFFMFLFSAYQDNNAAGRIYYAFLMLGIVGMFYAPFLFLVPMVWVLMFTHLVSGSLRTVSASLLGVLTPWWVLTAFCMYKGDFSLLLDAVGGFSDFVSVMEWHAVPLMQCVSVGVVMLLALVGGVHFRIYNYLDKIRVRMLYGVLSYVCLFLAVLTAISPLSLRYLLPSLIVSASPLVGHYIALSSSRLSNVTFCVTALACLIITACNLWMRC